MRTATKSTIFIASVALAVAALTGCSAGGQSVADACKVIQTEGKSMTAEMEKAMSSAGSDPKAAAKSLKDAQGKLEDIADKVTNSEVKPVYEEFLGAYSQVADVVDTALADPSKAADAMQKLGDASTTIQESGEKLSKLCS